MSGDALCNDYPLRVKGGKAQKASRDVCVLYDIYRDSEDKDMIHYWFRMAMKERGRDQQKQIAGARDRHK